MVRRKDGRWQQELTVTEHGRKRQRFFYGKTKAEVLRKIADYQEQAERGRLFPEVADEWWSEHEPTLSPATPKSYLPALRRAKEYFDGVCVSGVRATDISDFLRSVAQAHKFTQKTLKTHLMVLNLVLRYAVQCGDIASNPARDVTVPKSSVQSHGRTVASDEDIDIIKRSYHTQMGMFAYWLLYTGCRRSELLCLTWEDVNVPFRMILINKSRYQVGTTVSVKPPKTEAGNRILPIPDKLLEVIETIPKSKRHGLVFPGRDGGIIKERRFELDWNRFRKETGVKCTPHQLRHCYATMLFENNVSSKDAQELMGHADSRTTENVYTHLRDARKAKVREGLYGIDIG